MTDLRPACVTQMVVTMRAEIIALFEVVDGPIVAHHEHSSCDETGSNSDTLHTASKMVRHAFALRRSQREFLSRGVGGLGVRARLRWQDHRSRAARESARLSGRSRAMRTRDAVCMLIGV